MAQHIRAQGVLSAVLEAEGLQPALQDQFHQSTFGVLSVHLWGAAVALSHPQSSLSLTPGLERFVAFLAHERESLFIVVLGHLRFLGDADELERAVRRHRVDLRHHAPDHVRVAQPVGELPERPGPVLARGVEHLGVLAGMALDAGAGEPHSHRPVERPAAIRRTLTQIERQPARQHEIDRRGRPHDRAHVLHVKRGLTLTGPRGQHDHQSFPSRIQHDTRELGDVVMGLDYDIRPIPVALGGRRL